MRRWNFAGGFATHGNSKKHRAPVRIKIIQGSIGNRTSPGRVWPGKKMAGRMGNKSKLIRNLLVCKIDFDRSLLYIKGGVPGNRGSVVQIYDAAGKARKQYQVLNFPTFIPEEGVEYPSLSEFAETQDYYEIYQHDNDEVLGVSGEEDEAHGAKEGLEDDDEQSMKKGA